MQHSIKFFNRSFAGYKKKQKLKRQAGKTKQTGTKQCWRDVTIHHAATKRQNRKNNKKNHFFKKSLGRPATQDCFNLFHSTTIQTRRRTASQLTPRALPAVMGGFSNSSQKASSATSTHFKSSSHVLSSRHYRSKAVLSFQKRRKVEEKKFTAQLRHPFLLSKTQKLIST